ILIITCLIMASAMTFFMPNKNAEAFTLTNGKIPDSLATNLGELLLSGYESRSDGKIFSGVFWKLIEQISGEKNPTKQTLKNLGSTGISADNIRNFNGGKDVTITIGGKKWTATYVSRSKPKNADDPNDKGDAILTLWLATSQDNKISTAKWGNLNQTYLGNYPMNMYGSSYMRAVALNNGGGYATSYNSAALTTVAQNASSDWAIYTMPNSTTSGQEFSGSIIDYIEVPDKMQWQHDQKALDYVTSSVYTNNIGCNNNNDALDYGGTGGTGDYSTNEYVKTEAYKGWANDRIWLPSLAETGVDGEEGLWKLSGNQRSNDSIYTWTRSAYGLTYNMAYGLSAAGGLGGNGDVSGALAIRPAFHLNLNKVAESATLSTPIIKGNNKKYSNDDNTTFELDKINENLVDINITATGVKQPDGTVTPITNIPTYNVINDVLSFTPSEVGEYTVSVTPKTGYCWSDGSTDPKTYTYKLKYHVTPLELNVANPNN
ncbi:MAG: hypothetical protein K2J13_04980, partial [Clostridia bacterium]|nr:hypothetical protein [Clostridia bacterium]